MGFSGATSRTGHAIRREVQDLHGPRSDEHMRTFFAQVAQALPVEDDLLLVGDGEVVEHFAEQARTDDDSHGRRRRIEVEKGSPLTERQLLRARSIVTAAVWSAAGGSMDVVEFRRLNARVAATRNSESRAVFQALDLAPGAIAAWPELICDNSRVWSRANDALRGAVAELEAFLGADNPEAR